MRPGCSSTSWFGGVALAAATAARRGGPGWACYALGVTGLAGAWLGRATWPGRLFIWSTVCDLAGFALLAAGAGWALPRLAAAWGRSQPVADREGGWFCIAQAGWIGGTAVLSSWIALDFGFDGVGQQVALFHLAGRASGAAAALMLVGAAILMAWQSGDAWRPRWQYAALLAGVLFTSSLGWSRVDPAAAVASRTSAWLERSETLMISAGMMTMMSGWGLRRLLPAGSDWVARGRQAMPCFGGLTLLMLVLVLLQRIVLAARL